MPTSFPCSPACAIIRSIVLSTVNTFRANSPAFQSHPKLRFGDFEYDPARKELRKHGIRIRLQPQPLAILVALLDSPGALVSREALRARLWGSKTFVEFEQGLNSAVRRLRDALCDSADEPRYIQTVPGEGYRLIAAVQGLPAPAIVPATEDLRPQALPISRPRINRQRWLLITGLALALAVAGFATVALLHLRRQSETKQPLRLSAGPVRMVVLPFVNLTGDPQQEYLCDGITEELITVLGSLRPGRLDVIARTSAMHFKNTMETAPQIGRELRVEYLLESTVQQSGSGLRITAQLIHASDARHVWAGEFDLRSNDLTRSQQDVAAAIADNVQLTLAPPSGTRARVVRTANPEAYRYYLLGRYYWNKRNREGLQSARTYFERAIKSDPTYARAYAGLADDYLVLGGGFMPASDAYPAAKVAAQKALALDDRLAEAYASLAYEQFIQEWDWQDAEANYRRSIALDPNYVTAHEWYAIFLAAMRRNDHAVTEIDRALELDPVSLPVNYNAASIYLQAGRNAEAFALAKKALEIDRNSTPAHLTLGAIYERTSRYPQAIAEFEKASQMSGERPSYTILAAHSYALAGNRAKAVAILQHWLPTADRPLAGAYGPALVYAALGQKEHALYWLKKAVAQRSCSPTEINTDWRLDPLRSDPRFAQIRAQFKLPN